MRSMKFIPGFLLILAVLSQALTADAQPVRIHASSDSLRAGAVFELYILFDNPGPFDRIVFPDSSAFSDPLEFRGRMRAVNRAGSDSVRYSLQFFGSEDFWLDGLFVKAVKDGDTLRFDIPEMPFYFKSTLDGSADLRPLKPIFAFKGPILPWVLGGLLLLAIAIAAYFIIKKMKNREPVVERPAPVIKPFHDPGRSLESGIDLLEEEFHTRKITDEAFYVRAGDLVREYYEKVHKFPAMEQTTREVIAEVHKTTSSQAHINRVRDILRECDLVKFARMQTSGEKMNDMLTNLRRFADAVLKEDEHLILAMKKRHEMAMRKLLEETEETT